MSLEQRQSCNQGINAHCKDINALITEIYRTFSGQSSYFIKNNFYKKDARYNLRTPNLLSQSKITITQFVFTRFICVPVTCGTS